MTRSIALLGALAALVVLPLLGAARSVVQNQGTSLWAFVLCVLAAFAAVGFLLPGRHRPFLIVNVLAAYAAIYIAEAYLTYFAKHQELSAKVALQQWWNHAKSALENRKNSDSRSKIEVLNDFRVKGVDAVPVVAGSNFLIRGVFIDGIEVVPAAGISNRMTVNCNEYGVWATYRADEIGFNNPRGLWTGSVTTAILGDSFTYGACVPEGQSLVDHVRRSLPSTLSLGMGGTGPLLVLARIREYLNVLKPREVVYVYYEGNDLPDLERESLNPILKRYLQRGFSQGLAGKVPALDKALVAYADEQERSGPSAAILSGLYLTQLPPQSGQEGSSPVKFKDFIKLRKLRAMLDSAGAACKRARPFDDGNLDLFEEVLKLAKQDIEQWGGHFKLVYLPEWQSFLEPAYFACYKRRDRVLAIAAKLGIEVLDVASHIKSDELNKYWFSPQTHFSENGYRLVGAIVASWLLDGRRSRR